MIRVVLDTNTVVSALIKPFGLEATVLLLALRGDIALFVSPPILAEYQRVLYKPKLKFDPRRVEAVLLDIGRAASCFIRPAYWPMHSTSRTTASWNAPKLQVPSF